MDNQTKVRTCISILEVTQREFGVMMGTTQNTVAKWLSGDRQPGGSAAILMEHLAKEKAVREIEVMTLDQILKMYEAVQNN